MKRLLTNYGMVLVLIALCVLFSCLTIKEQTPTGPAAVKQLLRQVEATCDKSDTILVVGAAKRESGTLAGALAPKLETAGFAGVRTVVGSPRDLRVALDDLKTAGRAPAAIVTGGDVVRWRVLERVPETHPEFAAIRLLVPRTHRWPDFLKWSNFRAIVDRIVVIAVIAIGMTMVIITAGIDLSVGSLIALSAVIGTTVMKQMGGLEASGWVVLVGFLAGALACGLVGGLGGFIVAQFKVPPFITTLGIMMMARGLAFMITGGFSIYQVPKSLAWLGQGWSLGFPNTVLLLVVLYLVAHVFMAHTRLGRYIYAVGGNEQAARLSGVPVKFVIVFVYMVSGLAAGLGGCIQASQLNTGTPNMGVMFELYVIAAVVVGGTSLAGGAGRILGTLIGAFIISVIQNGMNLLGMESYTQQVVLGAVILGAVLIDRLRSGKHVTAFFARKQE
ncbi:MAG: ABC transporter permease [Lentisphaerae bacterium]|jgi:ribose transport system permease protein|nr:ABC transporter permease [Lentisphaerota bacterium]MBT5607451.1 ABC transporter permease [Lentisphaerota bacterium]MBT7054134.1 ABC transporter permease [Lentisphaerota bacterium]MBT7842074.1 ABC transporter permease [Lentisphaerota bacterium]